MHSLYGVTMLHITRKSLDLPPSTLQLQCYTDVQNKMIYTFIVCIFLYSTMLTFCRCVQQL